MALFDRLAERVAMRATEMREQALRRVEQAVEAFPDIMIKRDRDMVVIEAMGLARRWLSDVRLRFAFWRRG